MVERIVSLPFMCHKEKEFFLLFAKVFDVLLFYRLERSLLYEAYSKVKIGNDIDEGISCE